nr:collagen alpha-1(III) chain-like [Pelodiscus sinensis]|eukprot:XP_025041735.1 collagen alpha-1(III) chain-like [Pelodiscus sinensis]
MAAPGSLKETRLRLLCSSAPRGHGVCSGLLPRLQAGVGLGRGSVHWTGPQAGGGGVVLLPQEASAKPFSPCSPAPAAPHRRASTGGWTDSPAGQPGRAAGGRVTGADGSRAPRGGAGPEHNSLPPPAFLPRRARGAARRWGRGVPLETRGWAEGRAGGQPTGAGSSTCTRRPGSAQDGSGLCLTAPGARQTPIDHCTAQGRSHPCFGIGQRERGSGGGSPGPSRVARSAAGRLWLSTPLCSHKHEGGRSHQAPGTRLQPHGICLCGARPALARHPGTRKHTTRTGQAPWDAETHDPHWPGTLGRGNTRPALARHPGTRKHTTRTGQAPWDAETHDPHWPGTLGRGNTRPALARHPGTRKHTTRTGQAPWDAETHDPHWRRVGGRAHPPASPSARGTPRVWLLHRAPPNRAWPCAGGAWQKGPGTI